MKKVAIAITTFMNPQRLACLLGNMDWAGWPAIPTHVIIDAPYEGWEKHQDILKAYKNVISYHPKITKTHVMDKWGCMQGSIQHAFIEIEADWIIYVPDDVLFTKGGLFNELGGVYLYGNDFVGGIQAPYWNASDLIKLGVMSSKQDMLNPRWRPDRIPTNPHWNGEGLPRLYVNLNGAGFSLNRQLWKDMGGWPHCTWRLDEYAGYMSWKLGYVCLTLPGPPRIHYFAATVNDQPMIITPNADVQWRHMYEYYLEEAWIEATGRTLQESVEDSYARMLPWGGDGREVTTLLKPIKEQKRAC